MRKILIFLNRFYNQNKNIIWFIIIAIALFLLFIKTATNLVKENNNSSSVNNATTIVENGQSSQHQLNTSNVNTANNSVQNEIEIVESIDSNQEAIRVFIRFCNEGKIESAYNMLTDDCKEYLYPSKNEFFKNYYNIFFDTKKEAVISTYTNNIYRVGLSEDSITTGSADKNKETVIDYITVNNNYKLSISSFVKKEKINKTQENEYISINIKEKYIYADYEIYAINVKNLTKADIYLNETINSDLFIQDKNGNNINLDINEYIEEDFKIISEQEKNINLKFNRKYDGKNTTSNIVFSNIKIVNKIYYDSSKTQNIINGNSQQTLYERKMSTYPNNIKVNVEIN